MRERIVFVLAAVLLCLVPAVVPAYLLTLIIEALIFGLFAMSLDLLVGYTRLYSFGHAAAYGLGAYSTALLLLHLQLPLPIGILLGVAISVLISIPIAWICTKSTGVSFAMLTLAFAQLGYAMLFRFKEISGGSDGIGGITRPTGPFGLDFFQSKNGYFYLVVFCLLGSYLLCSQLVKSPFGSVLAGIRENEEKTRALGYNTRAYKLAVVVAAYGFGSLAGALYTPFAGFVAPELFFWMVSGRVLIMVIVGGAGTLIGPIIGGIFFVVMEHQLSEITNLWPLIFGAIFIAFVMLAPEGIWGLLTKYLQPKSKAPVYDADRGGTRGAA